MLVVPWISKRVGSFNWIGILTLQKAIGCNCLGWLLIDSFQTHLLNSADSCIHSVHTFTTVVFAYTRKKDKQNKMAFGRSLILLGLCLLMLMPTGATRLPQYGLQSVDGFCEGWGELDQLGDISSQVLNAKYPYMGPIRVS